MNACAPYTILVVFLCLDTLVYIILKRPISTHKAILDRIHGYDLWDSFVLFLAGRVTGKLGVYVWVSHFFKEAKTITFDVFLCHQKFPTRSSDAVPSVYLKDYLPSRLGALLSGNTGEDQSGTVWASETMGLAQDAKTTGSISSVQAYKSVDCYSAKLDISCLHDVQGQTAAFRKVGKRYVNVISTIIEFLIAEISLNCLSISIQFQ